MKFHLQEVAVSRNTQYQVMCETEEFCIVVGWISGYRGKWNFHSADATPMMKDAAREELLTWADGQVNVKNITERMLK